MICNAFRTEYLDVAVEFVGRTEFVEHFEKNMEKNKDADCMEKNKDAVQKLIKEKDEIECAIQDHESILRLNNVTMKTLLVDSEGYPRADVDVYSIRNSRVALIRLYNDLEAKRNEIHNSLILVHQSIHKVPSPLEVMENSRGKAFARITGVAPNSPADVAGLKRGDLILEFGHVSAGSSSALQDIAAELSNNEFVCLTIR